MNEEVVQVAPPGPKLWALQEFNYGAYEVIYFSLYIFDIGLILKDLFSRNPRPCAKSHHHLRVVPYLTGTHWVIIKISRKGIILIAIEEGTCTHMHSSIPAVVCEKAYSSCLKEPGQEPITARLLALQFAMKTSFLLPPECQFLALCSSITWTQAWRHYSQSSNQFCGCSLALSPPYSGTWVSRVCEVP